MSLRTDFIEYTPKSNSSLVPTNSYVSFSSDDDLKNKFCGN